MSNSFFSVYLSVFVLLAYLHISKTIDACRVHLFDIVTQYKALFPDDDTILAGIRGNTGRQSDGTLFCGWLNSKVGTCTCNDSTTVVHVYSINVNHL